MSSFNAATTTNPACLGFVAPTAGTPKKVTSNFDNLDNVFFQSLSIQAHPSNTGLVYVLSNGTAADTTNGTNIVAVLAAGQSIPFSGVALGGINPSQFYIDVSATGNKAIPTVFSAA